jgi:hypothetical protein
MKQGASVVYGFCSGVAAFLILVGLWNALFGNHGHATNIRILIFCLLIAATFYLCGLWSRSISGRAEGP